MQKCVGFLLPSQLCLAIIFINPQHAFATSPPTISPAGGLYFPGPSVTISAGGGSTIYFTTDGSEPTVSSQIYSSAIPINATTTVNAIAVSGGVPSTVTTSVFTVDPTIKPTQLDPAAAHVFLWLRSDVGVTSSSGTVSNWSDQSGDGKDASQATGGNRPTLTANDYNGYSTIATTTSKYFNLLSGFSNIPNPIFYFATKPTSTSNGVLIDLGNGSASNNVTASTASPAATLKIYQGSTPSSMTASSGFTNGQYQVISMAQLAASGQPHIYIDGLAVSTTGTPTTANSVTRSQNHIGTDSSTAANFYDGKLLEIIGLNGSIPGGMGSNQIDSYLAARYQTAAQIPSAPVISVPTGTLTGPTQVAIAVPADCVCKYTLDGTTPSTGSLLYDGPLNIYYSQTLKAIAIKNDQTSSVASEAYTLDSNQWPAPDAMDNTALQVNVQLPAN